MSKRVSELDITELDEVSTRKRIKEDTTPQHVNGQKVNGKNSIDRSDLQFFIKDPKMVQILQKKGIKKFFPIQYETYNFIENGDDLIARDRTGSGKTIAFALPIIERLRKTKAFQQSSRVKFLIVLPTRQLAIQVRNEIKSLKLKQKGDFEVLAVYGGTDMREQIDRIRDGCDIIVSTPGRLLDLLEKDVIKLSDLQVTCLDQADQMLKQGFQEDIERIFEYIEKKAAKKTQNLLFSATIPPWVVQLSKKYLSPERKYIDLIKDSDMKTSKTVEHLSLSCPYYHRNSVIADLVNLYGGRHGRTIIFCQTKKQVNQILLKANLKQQTQALHGDIPQKQRQVTFQSFKEGNLKCLIATNVAARGLDIPQVDLILQLQPPKQIDAYIHRAGRTGRAGKSGVCITFYTRQQQPLLQRIQRKAKIRFKKIGPPQPVDIVKASARDIVISLKSVNEEVLGSFNDIAEQMIAEQGPVKALSKALAYISGNTKKIPQRSLLFAIEGYITYIIRSPTQFQSNGYIFNFLRRNTSENLTQTVKGMRKLNKKSVVFDVAQDFKPQMDQLIEKITEGSNYHLKGFQVQVVKTMDVLQQQQQQNKQKGKESPDSFDERDIRDAIRNKRDWEIFIGSLPQNCDQSELVDYFKSRKVRITNIRILRNEQGQSKCVGFGLCLDEDSLRKALKLDGERFGNKTLRINKASKR